MIFKRVWEMFKYGLEGFIIRCTLKYPFWVLYYAVIFFSAGQLERKLMKRMKWSDLSRFYQRYISPHRRKLAVYVTPLKLACRFELSQESAVMLKDQLAVKTGKKLPSIQKATQIEGKKNSFGKVASKTKPLTPQSRAVDSLLKGFLQELEKNAVDIKLTLPKVD
jgi:hypothetical protein